ncbi:MAG: hypothetical protein V4658_14115 [Bacteroidota bacterium]
MKRILLLLLSALTFSSTQSQVTINQFVNKDETAIFNSDAYNNIITRQNSCSFYINDFIFSVTKNDKYIVDLQINLNSYNIGSTTPDKVKTIRMLFKDVIEIKEKDKPITLTLSNKKLADNIILSDVTDIDIIIKLIPIQDENNSAFKLIAPILNTSFQAAPAVTSLIDNFIENVRKGEKKEELLFSSNITIPLNIFEYRKIETDAAIPLLKNNLTFGAILKGNQAVPFNTSLVGDVATFFNGVSQFVAGKNVIPKNEMKYEGVVKIYFTKDNNPLLPSSFSRQLDQLDKISNNPQTESSYSAFKVKLNEISTQSDNLLYDQKINSQTDYSIQQYLQLGVIYLDYLKAVSNGNPTTTDAWITQFRTYDININTKGAANGFQAIGITDLYSNDKIAKIYIPYSLPENLTLSYYSWQFSIHNFLTEKKYELLAKAKPKLIEIKVNRSLNVK